ncbi:MULTISPECIES: CopK family periplasmic copper-binding protein [Massilia]|uniref:CopK family periplasmic copper-binding protein n=1 Tax=Massilia TaxID=149698 RepID=UPI00070645E7|nr:MULTISPECIES: CopK family periplasmic copper-binding protein [Massilia]ALK97742.1 hypothetical protein AM586_17545 [Massilia sp. WG5]
MKKLLVASMLFAASAASFASAQDEKLVPLKSGETLHVYADGKMAMEDKYGHPTGMKPGQIMETKDGQKMIMRGNETARLDMQLQIDNGGRR